MSIDWTKTTQHEEWMQWNKINKASDDEWTAERKKVRTKDRRCGRRTIFKSHLLDITIRVWLQLRLISFIIHNLSSWDVNESVCFFSRQHRCARAVCNGEEQHIYGSWIAEQLCVKRKTFALSRCNYAITHNLCMKNVSRERKTVRIVRLSNKMYNV